MTAELLEALIVAGSQAATKHERTLRDTLAEFARELERPDDGLDSDIATWRRRNPGVWTEPIWIQAREVLDAIRRHG